MPKTTSTSAGAVVDAGKRRIERNAQTWEQIRQGPRSGLAAIAAGRKVRTTDAVAAIRDLTGGNGADVVFECAGGSPKQGLSGCQTLLQAIDAVRSGGKIVGVSWFGGPLELYALKDDPGEQRNVAAQHPEVVERLRAAMRQAHTPSPIWKAPGEG